MEIWAAIILTAGLLAVLVVVLICQKKNQDYRKKCIRAAQRIIREEYLDGSIMKGGDTRRLSGKTMIVLRIKGNKDKGYVFDPQREICIGRSLESSDLCLSDPAVSSHHSRIFLCQGQVCIQDMDSANGTVILRPGRERRTIWGDTGFLYDRSKIWVGDTCIFVRIFQCKIYEG